MKEMRVGDVLYVLSHTHDINNPEWRYLLVGQINRVGGGCGCCDLDLIYKDKNRFKIVGNIFDTPELLEKIHRGEE